MNTSSLNTSWKLTKWSLLFSLGLSSSLLSAGTLNISNSALEIADGVEPNVMFLADDSGSMDWGGSTSERNGVFHLPEITGAAEYYYTHPAPGSGGNPPAINNFFWVMPDPEFMAARGLAAPQGGAWRAWNHNYNKIYYNPNIEYTPWKGQDINGNPFSNMPPTAALYNPNIPANGSLNLTANVNYQTYCGLAACAGVPGVGQFVVFTVTNFYPSRYYQWTDSTVTGTVGKVDVDDPHVLVEIRPGSPNFTRTGTRTDCGGDGDITSTTSCTAAQEMQNFANWFSYYRKRDLTAKNAFSKVIEPSTNARVGYATLHNNNNVRVQVQPMNVSIFSGAKLNLMNRMLLTIPSGGTPLRRRLEQVGNYFACNSITHIGNIFSTGNSTPGNANCPVQASPAGECQQNYTILSTDGFWNGGHPHVNNADGDGAGGAANGPFDGASFADATPLTLADVAMHYYERDLHGSLTDDVPTTTTDKNRYTGTTAPFDTMHQHMTTYTIGFGVSGSLNANPASVTAAFAWPAATSTTSDASKIDDLRHAAWNGRGSFLDASSPEELVDSLQNIFDEIQAGTGSASAVAFNTQDLQSGSRVFRAFFNTILNTGSLVAQDINLTGDISPIKNWDAAKELDSKADKTTDTRSIVTYDGNALKGIPFLWASLNTTQQGQLKAPTITSSTPTPNQLGKNRLDYLRGQTGEEGPDFNAGKFRERPVIGGKLGDIIHSAPVFVGAPPFAGRDLSPFPDTTGNLYSDFASARSGRNEVVYIGANDGMLHGFDADTGSEVFAYVPNSLFASLSELTDPDYTHRYFVDMTAAINDVYITPADGTNSGVASWNTVAVGGLGVGGPGYFALNLTDPSSLNSESSAAKNVMWEFTQADDIGTGPGNNNLNLGVHVREPVIAMSNVDGPGGQKRWVAIFGNGYNSASPDGDAELYILFLDGGLDGTWTRGSDFIKLNTGNGKAESTDGTTPNGLGAVQAIDTNGDGTVDVVYAGDYQGNVYRFNLNSTTVGGLTSPSNRPVQKLFTASYNDSGTPQPITNRPAVIKHPQLDGYIVIVGTGSYFTVEDSTSNDIQSIYGLWDDFVDTSDNIVPVNYSKLQEQMFMNAANVNGLTVRTLTDIAFDFGTSSGKKQGWVIDLDVTSGGSVEFPGERAVRNFLLRGSFVFVNTVIPKSNTACTTGPGSFTLGFNPVTGGSGVVPVFDTNNDGIFDENDNIGGLDDPLNVASAIRSDSTLTDSATMGGDLISQGSGDDGKIIIEKVGINTAGKGDEVLGRHSWREIEPN